MSTHYATLGLASGASDADIRRAYRQLVWITHPDRTPDPAAHERYLAVNDAYEVLSNPARRASYDAALEWRATASRRPAPTPTPSTPFSTPPRYARQGSPAQPRRRTQQTTSFDLRPYARPIHWLGRALLVFGLLLLLDYSFLYYTSPARVKALKAASPDSLTTLTTTRGKVTVYGQLPTDILNTQLQVRSSLVFQFAQAAWLPNGLPLKVKPVGTTLPGFVYFMLSLALLSQWRRLSLAMRLNSLMLASATAVIIVLIMVRL